MHCRARNESIAFLPGRVAGPAVDGQVVEWVGRAGAGIRKSRVEVAMHSRELSHFQQRLQRRRVELQRSRLAAERGLQEVREGRTDPEYEEGAQADHVEYTLNQVSDTHQRELAQIDAALDRIDAKTYGECLECGGEIPLERLEALPYAMLDAECAARREEERFGVMRAPTL